MLKTVRSIGELELKLKGLEASLPKAIEITFDQDLYLNNLAELIGLHKEYYRQKAELERLFDSSTYDKDIEKFNTYSKLHTRNEVLETFLLKYVEADPSTVNLTME